MRKWEKWSAQDTKGRMKEKGGPELEEGTLMPSVPDIEWKSLRVGDTPRKGTRQEVALGSAFAESESW